MAYLTDNYESQPLSENKLAEIAGIFLESKHCDKLIAAWNTRPAEAKDEEIEKLKAENKDIVFKLNAHKSANKRYEKAHNALTVRCHKAEADVARLERAIKGVIDYTTSPAIANTLEQALPQKGQSDD
jgi:hypothetical protein